MSTYIQISDEIASRLSTVTNIGRVYTWQRAINDSEILKTDCWDSQLEKINTWWISRESFRDEQSANTQNTISSVYQLTGVMSLDDADQTELLFQQVIDDISDKFRPQGSLTSTVELTRPIQARLIGYTTFAGVLCHTAQLTMEVQEVFNS